MCGTMTIVALVIAVQRVMCICAPYRLISGRHDIVLKRSFTAAKSPWIWIQTNCGKVCRFGCELGIRNNITVLFIVSTSIFTVSKVLHTVSKLAHISSEVDILCIVLSSFYSRTCLIIYIEMDRSYLTSTEQKNGSFFNINIK